MSYVSAPVYLISLIVPIRESGSMVPQVFLSKYVKKQPVRKWIWVLGSFLQFLAIASIGFIALNFEGTTAGWLIIIAVIIFSLSRSICSLSSKDVTGKTIPKTRRGKLKGYTVSASGILVLAAGLFILYQSKSEQTITFYSYLIFFASAMWLIAAVIYSRIKEFPEDTDASDDDKTSFISKLKLLKKDAHFRDFVIARSLLLCSALTAPYYILLGAKIHWQGSLFAWIVYYSQRNRIHCKLGNLGKN